MVRGLNGSDMSQRIHIFGASGSGTSTLGRALATEWGTQFFDTDDFFWEPTDPPFVTKRRIEDRLTLMQQMFLPRRDWVLCGSLMGWGDRVIPHFDLVVFLYLDPGIRLARLRAREIWRYGAEALEPGGSQYREHQAFLDWASSYDDPNFGGRSLHAHRAWLQGLPCPVLELDAACPTSDMVTAVNQKIAQKA